MEKIYHVIQLKLNQLIIFKKMSIGSLINKAYLSAITVTNISQSFYLQDGVKNQLT